MHRKHALGNLPGKLIGACLIMLLPAIASAAAHSALWSLKGKSNTIYLLGSVHFLKPTDSLPASIDSAYADAERIIMEMDMDDLDPLAAQQATMQLGLLPEGRTLEGELGAESYQKVVALARQVGLDATLLNRFRPWLAAMTLVQLQLIKHGLDPTAGVEQRLVARATADGKEITGLETLEQQLSLMADLPAKQQREFLMFSVEDAERTSTEIDGLITAWRAGDTGSLESILVEGFEKYPDLYRPLTVDRNRAWLPHIEELLDDKDDYLVVVGTLHLVGANSVIDLLKAKGHKITQH